MWKAIWRQKTLPLFFYRVFSYGSSPFRYEKRRLIVSSSQSDADVSYVLIYKSTKGLRAVSFCNLQLHSNTLFEFRQGIFENCINNSLP